MYGNTSSAYKTYETNSITTASPKGLIMMLYDGAIKFCRLAEMAIDENNIERRNYNLKKAQDILIELRVTLNHDAGELAKNLEILYEFMYNQLVQANTKNDQMQVVEIRTMMTELKDTWKLIS